MPNHLHGIIWTLDLCTGEASAEPRHRIPKPLRSDASPLQTRSGFGFDFFDLGKELFYGAFHPTV
jgi:hypothetical protein